MSDYFPTNVRGIAAKVSVDWVELAQALSDAASDEQAYFIESFASAFTYWSDTAASRQLDLIAETINNTDLEVERSKIRWLLTELLNRIPEEAPDVD